MTGVDEAVEQLERLYRSVTGKAVPSGAPYTAIPPEKDPVRHVQEQLDRLLHLLGRPVQAVDRLAPWIPRVAVWEGEREILVQVELSGVTRDSLNVSASPGSISVSGWRPLPTSGAERPTLAATELSIGPFVRSIALPQGVATNDISAQLRDGMLEIRVRRSPANSGVGAQGHTIAVK